MKLKTHDDYDEELRLKRGVELLVLGNYINHAVKIDHECQCGCIWSVSPASVLRGSGCPECSLSLKRKTQEQYVEDVRLKHGDKITVLGKYINSGVKIDHECQCGCVWSVIPTSVLRGSGCPECGAKRRRGKAIVNVA
jgi:hypothetical protein